MKKTGLEHGMMVFLRGGGRIYFIKLDAVMGGVDRLASKFDASIEWGQADILLEWYNNDLTMNRGLDPLGNDDIIRVHSPKVSKNSGGECPFLWECKEDPLFCSHSIGMHLWIDGVEILLSDDMIDTIKTTVGVNLLMVKVRIDDWTVFIPEQPYIAPELLVRVLSGVVTGHPRHEDGTFVTTSSIELLNPLEGTIVTSSGTQYILGEVAEEYEYMFPGAKERLLKSLVEKQLKK